MSGLAVDFRISLVADGTMRIRSGTEAAANRAGYFERHDIDPQTVVAAKLDSGTEITWVDHSHGGQIIDHVDGLITTERSLYLSITVADCLPIVIYKSGVVCALLHCGWRGLAGHLLENAITMIDQKTGIRPHELSAYIGPGIEQHHYPVSAETAHYFEMYPAIIEIDGVLHLDLKRVAYSQLRMIGILPRQIETSSACTYCTPTYFSARRDKDVPVSAMMVLAALV